MDDRERDPLAHRDRRLVLGLAGLVADMGGPVSELEIADVFVERWSTAERVLRELVAYGVLRVVGSGRARGFVVTTLGRAWLAREVAPWPWPDEGQES